MFPRPVPSTSAASKGPAMPRSASRPRASSRSFTSVPAALMASPVVRQIVRPEGDRQQLAEREGAPHPFRPADMDGRILAREFAQALPAGAAGRDRSEEHTSELQSRENLVCRLLLEKKKRK